MAVPGKLAWSPVDVVSQRPEIDSTASEVVRLASSIPNMGFVDRLSPGCLGRAHPRRAAGAGFLSSQRRGKMKSVLVWVGVVAALVVSSAAWAVTQGPDYVWRRPAFYET